MMTSVPCWRMRSVTSTKYFLSHDSLPVSGSRTWMWTIEAPARAASSAAAAISLGVTGTFGFLATVSEPPVRAQQMDTLDLMGACLLDWVSGLGGVTSFL